VWEQDVLKKNGLEVESYSKKVQQHVDAQDFFDNPHSSTAANFFSSLVLACIIISTITLCIETMDQYKNDTAELHLFIVESICVFVFTMEYIGRISLSHEKLNFIVEPMNIVDLVAIVPYFITLLLTYGFHMTADELASLGVVRLVRLVRIFRILKLAKNMPTLKIIVKAVVESLSSLTLMLFILLVMLIVFGAFEYFFERGESEFCNDFSIKTQAACTGTYTVGSTATARVWYNDPWHRKRCGSGYNGISDSDPDNCSLSPYISIPQSMWWCLVTLLTVGYGDIYPITIGGKCVAASAMMISVVILALPISIIGTNFVDFWAIEEAHELRKQDPHQLGTSAKTTKQSLSLFLQTMKYNIDKSESLKLSVIRLLSEMGPPKTEDERCGRPGAARQGKMYRLKAAEQLLYVLRTKNLRLLPLEDADSMVANAQDVAEVADAEGKATRERRANADVQTPNDITLLSNHAFFLRKQWQSDRDPASLKRALDRSKENAQWFGLMQEEHKFILKELAIMRKVLGVAPGEFIECEVRPATVSSNETK